LHCQNERMESKYNEKQVQILIAAENLFSEQGFNGTSVRDIANAANVNLAMISYYFGSKEKLLEAIFAFRIESTSIKLEYLLAKTDIEPVQKIELLVDHYIDKLQNNTNFFKIMQSQQLKGDFNKDLSEIIYQSKKKNYDLISALIAEGQKKGQFKKTIDIALLMSTLVGASNQIYMGHGYYKRLHQLEDMPEDKFQQLLRKRMKVFMKNMFKAILTYEI
jgi:AcrR family transcriptional regulator